MHKKVYFVGRQSMYKAIEKIASEEFELVFKKEKKSESFEECRNIAENLSQDLIEPVLVEGSMVANQKNTSFLYYIDPCCTKISAVTTNNADTEKNCMHNFNLIRCHM